MLTAQSVRRYSNEFLNIGVDAAALTEAQELLSAQAV